MKRLIIMSLLALTITGTASAGMPTVSEEAAEQCESPAVVAEFAHGNQDACYGVMVGEIAGARELGLVTYEDGSGTLYDHGVRVGGFPSDTFPWDCKTQGNRLCGPQTATTLPRTS